MSVLNYQIQAVAEDDWLNYSFLQITKNTKTNYSESSMKYSLVTCYSFSHWFGTGTTIKAMLMLLDLFCTAYYGIFYIDHLHFSININLHHLE